MKKTYLLVLAMMATTMLLAQSQQSLWRDIAEVPQNDSRERLVEPNQYRSLQLDAISLAQILADAPEEGTSSQETILELPTPDGSNMHFRIWESPVMAPGLAARFPKVKTYIGKGIEDATALLRADLTPQGFHAMVLSHHGTWMVDPYFRESTSYYKAYAKKDFTTSEGMVCEVEDEHYRPEDNSGARGDNPVGTELRTYRLAVAGSGDYTNYQGGVEQALAAMVTTMNRVNGLYERDLSVRMILVDSNHLVIFTDPNTDPYSGGNGQRMNQNQDVMDEYIGSANYDIGHIFDLSTGGIANLRSVCDSDDKGKGFTGRPNPVGDPFDIDYVAHEMGHQFGANHTFNNCGNQGPQPYEPGSATTIMGYAGLCGSNNIAPNSDDHFHVASFDEMAQFTLMGGGNACPVKTPTENTPPEVDAGPSGYIIPISTPFELTASAEDAEGDSLTYCWEQFDLGPLTPLGQPSGNAPAFRSYSPNPSPTRVFPRMINILNNNSTINEVLPTYSRDMTFRVSVRDNHGFGGGVDWDKMSLSATQQAGPFRVLSQATATAWIAGTYVAIEWDIANTDLAPVNASEVNIFLSDEGGYNYPTLLAENTANDGYEVVFIPEDIAGQDFRVKVKGAGNVFFDLNNAPISIQAPTEAGFSLFPVTQRIPLCAPETATFSFYSSAFLGFEESLTLTVDGLPEELTVQVSPESPTPPEIFDVKVSNTAGVATGIYDFQVTATGSTGSQTFNLRLEIYSGVAETIVLVEPVDGAENVSTLPSFAWEADANANNYTLEIANTPDFSDIFYTQSGIEGTAFDLDAPLVDSTLYFWRVTGANQYCGSGSSLAAGNFTTESIDCIIFQPIDTPVVFNQLPFIFSKIEVPDNLTIRDVNLRNIKGNYFPIEELSFQLRTPASVTFDLIPNMCGNSAAFDLNLDNEAAQEVPCPYDDGGTYRPQESFSPIYGTDAAGTWRLIIFDSGSQGQLENWELEICHPRAIVNSTEDAQLTHQLKVYPNPATDLLNVVLESQSRVASQFRLIDLNGRVLQTIDLDGGNDHFQIDLSNLPSGMYWYEWSEAGKSSGITGKVVKI
ncbi:MAG: hypothetical protein DHS20C18_03520 [Saprospiraceae bacterium]|nr:MAG: hypothetical protein DHS20C18_03520 [Saprospiraceae bacterium]